MNSGSRGKRELRDAEVSRQRLSFVRSNTGLAQLYTGIIYVTMLIYVNTLVI